MMQTLRMNSKGGDVYTLQQLLQEWGYDIPVTGNFAQMLLCVTSRAETA